MTGETGATARRPPGQVSQVRGRLQAPVLDWLTRLVLAMSVVGGFLTGAAGRALAVTAVTNVVVASPARVAWLVYRWAEERDRTFVGVGLALLGVIAFGGALALAGVG
jgi:hypothetical protein